MISYLEALGLLENNAQKIASEKIDVKKSLGRICSKDIFSQLNLPSFDNSAMDGFAVYSEATQNASESNPLRLEIGEIIPAAISDNKTALSINMCSEIMTGAAVPVGYDAVIPVELVNEINDNGKHYIEINQPIAKSANFRFSGEDVKSGELIIKQNSQILPADIMLFCALGINEIEVYKKIPISIAVSGEEISENYDLPLRHGEIYNSNAPLLINMSHTECIESNYYGILHDNKQSLIEYINANSHAKILITTGAVSKGKWDFIPYTLKELGAEIIFHSVAIRPGKPVLFAKLPDGRYFFGLPGNPVSSFVGWRFFVIPLVRRLFNLEREKTVTARINGKFTKKHQLRQFLKAMFTIEEGQVKVSVSKDQESFKIKPLVSSNCWVIVEEKDNLLNNGDLVRLVPLYHSFNG